MKNSAKLDDDNHLPPSAPLPAQAGSSERDVLIGLKFKKKQSTFIKGKYRFTKPVYLLINDKSVSAADVLSLMMAELDNVTIIGEASNGSYSDIYAKKLPNKWTVTLSNQRYLSTDMENYEGKGTPVDIEVKNRRENFETKKDLVLLEALRQMK